MHAIKRSFVRRRNLWSCEFKNPKALYESACANVTTLAFVCGTERFCSNYSRRNSRLILLLIDITLYLVLSFWCVTVLWGQLNDVIFCFVTMGGAVQAIAKITCYTDKQSTMNVLFDDIIKKHIKHTQYLSGMNKLLKFGILLNTKSLVAQSVFSCFVLATAEEIWYTGLLN
ncbi:hypothetical protein quinque_008103 [Culex quinquefasciatus]